MSLVKLAGLWDGLGKAALGFGKTLMQNNTLRNASIGSGVGALTGAATANPGERMKGALKGGLIGGVAGGAFTAGKNIYGNMKPNAVGAPGLSFGQALKAEGSSLASTVKDANWIRKNMYQVGKENASLLPPPIPRT